DVRPGLPTARKLSMLSRASRLMVLVFSANANASPHTPKEIERAVSHGNSGDPAAGGGRNSRQIAQLLQQLRALCAQGSTPIHEIRHQPCLATLRVSPP